MIYLSLLSALFKLAIAPVTSSTLQVPTDKRYQLELAEAPNAEKGTMANFASSNKYLVISAVAVSYTHLTLPTICSV